MASLDEGSNDAGISRWDGKKRNFAKFLGMAPADRPRVRSRGRSRRLIRLAFA